MLNNSFCRIAFSKIHFQLLLTLLISFTINGQGVGTGQRINLTTDLQLSSGQFAQLFVPDYYVAPSDGKINLVFHFHSASWAAEDQVYRASANAVLFNIHLGALSSPYQNYFVDQNKFQTILNLVLSKLQSLNIVQNPQIENLIVTSFSAGYAGVREVLKNQSYYNMIKILNLADGLHSSSDLPSMQTQMKDFVRFAKDARDGNKIMLLTHSSITTSGYQSTTQTANYLIDSIGSQRTSAFQTDEIGTQTTKCDTGNFHLKGYLGNTANDHLKHLYGMHLMITTAFTILNSTTNYDDESDLDYPQGFILEQNYPNPFNPTTRIRYTIPPTPASLPLLTKEGIEGRFVTIKVHDTLGNEITTLVKEEQSAGSYEVEFDASVFSSGVYVYQLTAGEMIQSKKMMLLK